MLVNKKSSDGTGVRKVEDRLVKADKKEVMAAIDKVGTRYEKMLSRLSK